MSKDFPALRMTVEGGRLVPATSFDAERINSYRNKTLVLVKLSPPKDRVQIRKWFAILNLVMKQCDTPWKNIEQAHEAIKLALGIVNLSKTTGGQFMQYPKSLSELEDPELQEALEQMTELLSHMTGVDVATLKKEAADVGREIEQENTHSDAAPTSEEPEAPASATGEAVDIPSSPASYQLTRTDRTDLIECARKMFAIAADESLTLEGRRGVLATAKDTWKSHLPAELHEHLKSIFMGADAVIKGKAERKEAIETIAGMLECEPKDIGGNGNG